MKQSKKNSASAVALRKIYPMFVFALREAACNIPGAILINEFRFLRPDGPGLLANIRDYMRQCLSISNSDLHMKGYCAVKFDFLPEFTFNKRGQIRIRFETSKMNNLIRRNTAPKYVKIEDKKFSKKLGRFKIMSISFSTGKKEAKTSHHFCKTKTNNRVNRPS